MLPAPVLGFTLGVLFAWMARHEIARAAPTALASRSLSIVALYAVLVFGPACAYFLVLEPDWAGAYLFDAGRRARLVSVAGTLLALVSVPLGFLVAAPAARAQRTVSVLRLGAVAALSTLALTLALFPRLSVRATYAEFHGDFGTEPVAHTTLGWGLFWVFLVVAGATAYVASVLGRSAH
jgi:hypothetical protein